MAARFASNSTILAPISSSCLRFFTFSCLLRTFSRARSSWVRGGPKTGYSLTPVARLWFTLLARLLLLFRLDADGVRVGL